MKPHFKISGRIKKANINAFALNILYVENVMVENMEVNNDTTVIQKCKMYKKWGKKKHVNVE